MDGSIVILRSVLFPICFRVLFLCTSFHIVESDFFPFEFQISNSVVVGNKTNECRL